MQPPSPEDVKTVAALPRRVVHAVHALMVTVEESKMPAKAAEVVIYDEESFSAQQTSRALVHARSFGLAVYTGRYWVPTNAALELRSAFEDRFLADVDPDAR